MRGREHGALIPVFRTVIDLRNAPSNAANKPITELELDLAGADGDVRDGGRLTGEYRLVEGGVSMRLGRQFRDKVRLVGVMGLGLNRLDPVETAGIPRIDDDQTELGFRLGGELRLRFQDWLWGHGRVVSFIRPFDMMSTQSEIGLLIGHPDEMGLLVGYKDWRYDDESSSLAGTDDVDLRIDGWFIGLETRF